MAIGLRASLDYSSGGNSLHQGFNKIHSQYFSDYFNRYQFKSLGFSSQSLPIGVTYSKGYTGFPFLKH